MTRFILWLIRKQLGVKKYQKFVFVDQMDDSILYYFTRDKLLRWDSNTNKVRESRKTLNYLLSEECEVVIKDDSN